MKSAIRATHATFLEDKVTQVLRNIETIVGAAGGDLSATILPTGCRAAGAQQPIVHLRWPAADLLLLN